MSELANVLQAVGVVDQEGTPAWTSLTPIAHRVQWTRYLICRRPTLSPPLARPRSGNAPNLREAPGCAWIGTASSIVRRCASRWIALDSTERHPHFVA